MFWHSLAAFVSIFVFAKAPNVHRFVTHFFRSLYIRFCICVYYVNLFRCEFHRDATRHNLRFMLFIIISFVNFCIAVMLPAAPVCIVSISIFHNESLYQFNLYPMDAEKRGTHTIYLKYLKLGYFVLFLSTSTWKVFDLISCFDCFVFLFFSIRIVLFCRRFFAFSFQEYLYI